MRFLPLGDTGVLIRVGSGIDEETQRAVRSVVAAIDAHPPPGVTDVVPAYDSIAVFHDGSSERAPHATAFAALCAALRDRIATASAQPAPDESRLIEIPVRYGGEHGPDLESVASHAHISTARAIELHTGAEYRVAMIGFAPGFPYLSGLPAELETPRRATPRTLVPAGSVGIAGMQTGIYPLATPGGWQLIGRTDVRLFDAAADPPSLLRIGDRVRFRRA